MERKMFCGYSAIFFIVIGLNVYVSSELASVAALAFVLYAMSSTGFGVDRSAAKIIYPFLLLEFIGICLSFGNSADYVFKDAWYNAKIILYIQFGYILGCCIRSINAVFLTLVLHSAAIVCTYLYNLFIAGGFSDYNSAYEAGRIEILVALGLSLLIYRDLGFNKMARYFLILLLTTGIIFSYSRTLIGCALILMVALLGIFSSWDKVVRLVGGLLIVTMLLILVRQIVMFDGVAIEGDGFIGKVVNSFSEVAFVDQSDYESIMKNWRGFEAFNANEKFLSNSLFAQMFGNGFGATVDLGMDIEFEDRANMRYIPHLHNGYYYVVLKFGLCGLFAYLLFIKNIVKEFSLVDFDLECIFIKNLAYGIALVILYTTLVITGVYNKSLLDPYVILLGVMFGWRVRFKGWMDA